MTRVRDWLVSAAVLLAGKRAPGVREREDEVRIVPPGEPDPRAESWVIGLLTLATLAASAFVVLYALDPLAHRTQWLGLTLGLALAALAAALIVVGQRLVVTEELAKPYPEPDERAAGEVGQIVAESGSRLTRRRLLALTGTAAGCTLGLALVAPVLSLGPLLDTRALVQTPWRRGRRLVGEDGRRLAADAIEEGTFTTAFPEGAGREQFGAPLVVVRVAELDLPEGREDWAPGGIVAYSKVCTHAGCAVSIYRKPTFPDVQPRAALVCPCHYSTFDPARGGAVLEGPAGRPLPQLPLFVDRNGNLRAAGTFSGPVGPSWWGVRSRKASST